MQSSILQSLLLAVIVQHVYGFTVRSAPGIGIGSTVKTSRDPLVHRNNGDTPVEFAKPPKRSPGVPLEEPDGEVDLNDCIDIVNERWPTQSDDIPCVFWTSPADPDKTQPFIQQRLGGNGVTWLDIFTLEWADSAGQFVEDFEQWQPFALSSQAFAEKCQGTAYVIVPEGVDATSPDRPSKSDDSDSPFWNLVEFNTLTRNPSITRIWAVAENNFESTQLIWNSASQGPYGQAADVTGKMSTVAEVRPWTIAPKT